ncbi:phage endonuclease [Kitasatospora sp. Ki12]
MEFTIQGPIRPLSYAIFRKCGPTQRYDRSNHACIECANTATHRGRCGEHHRAFTVSGSFRARYQRWREVARRNDAGADLRRAVRANDGGVCARCGTSHLATALDVDHITPIAHGGEDVAENVQLLCRGCHAVKTRKEFRLKRQSP